MIEMSCCIKDGTQKTCNWMSGSLKERSESEKMAMKRQAEMDSRCVEDGTHIYHLVPGRGRRMPPRPRLSGSPGVSLFLGPGMSVTVKVTCCTCCRGHYPGLYGWFGGFTVTLRHIKARAAFAGVCAEYPSSRLTRQLALLDAELRPSPPVQWQSSRAPGDQWRGSTDI